MRSPSPTHCSRRYGIALHSLLWLLILVLSAVAPAASIFRWSFGSEPAVDQDRDYGRVGNTAPILGPGLKYTPIWDDVGSTEEISVMQHATDALKAYEDKPDCFKKAARALRKDCKNIDMDEAEKTKYAIQLTACEIATANMPVPVECQEISTPDWDQDQARTDAATLADVGRCVQSFGRVPQLWTSYSGYFREVKVMCLAVRFSLEHDDLRKLQLNLTRSHVDHIALLREQRRELQETHRLEETRLREILNLHSTMSREVSSLLDSARTKSLAGALRDSLTMILGDVSKIAQQGEQVTTQQSVALLNLQDANSHLLADYQMNVDEAVRSISEVMRKWHASLDSGFLRAQELDSINEEIMLKIQASSDNLDATLDHIKTTKVNARDLLTSTAENTRSIMEIHHAGAYQINATTSTVLARMLGMLNVLESQSHATWDNVMSTFKAGSMQLHDEVSSVLEETVLDIGNMATASQEQIEQLNRLVNEFQVKQGDILWQLQALHKTWGFLTVCEQLLSPVSYMHVLLVMICAKLCQRGVLYLCHLDRDMSADGFGQEDRNGSKDNSACYDPEPDYYYVDAMDAMDFYGPPPYHIREEDVWLQKPLHIRRTKAGTRPSPTIQTDMFNEDQLTDSCDDYSADMDELVADSL
ncbi:hypothetical protein EDD11_009309 [Mortierella claussenii]|nr:hypothetical protein EDD11_009309 [Mortierella claussenii]